MMNEQNRNTILAVILSGMVLIGWQYFFVAPQLEKQQAAQKAQQQTQQTQAPGAAPQGGAPRRRCRAIKPSPPHRA
jgi:YidC/Oxa1 family membrane protein insertase